jgi:hypothetical protein
MTNDVVRDYFNKEYDKLHPEEEKTYVVNIKGQTFFLTTREIIVLADELGKYLLAFFTEDEIRDILTKGRDEFERLVKNENI